MDPEDLLDQEVELIPGLEGHAEANMETLKVLDSLDVSYRYLNGVYALINYSRISSRVLFFTLLCIATFSYK